VTTADCAVVNALGTMSLLLAKATFLITPRNPSVSAQLMLAWRIVHGRPIRRETHVKSIPVNHPTPNLEQYFAAMQLLNLGGVPLDGIASENAELLHTVESLDPVRAASTFAGLLTVPELQSNCFRLEALIHLCLAFGRGKQKPTGELVARLFAEFGKGQCGRVEDPAEDVFVTLVVTPRGDFRVLEGTWESAGFFLQRVVNVVERMPREGGYKELRESIYALLALSDLVCERAGLTRYQLGNTSCLKALPHKLAQAGSALRRLVRFSVGELRAEGVSIDHLAAFELMPAKRGYLAAEKITHSALERHPVAYHNGQFFLLLPTAVSAAVRRYVFEFVNAIGMGEAMLAALADEYTALFARMPLLGGGSGADIEFRRTENGLLSGVMKSVDAGRYMNLVFFVDTLEEFERHGFAGANPKPEELAVDIEAWIDDAYEKARKEKDFREALTLVVSCGVGRVVVNVHAHKKRDNWRIEYVSAADLASLSLLEDFTPLSLWRLLDGRERLKTLGVSLQNTNGLLNMVAWARSLGGHLVPHGDLPDAFASSDRPKSVLVTQNALLHLRHEVVAHHDLHAVADINGNWRPVRREGWSIFEEDRARRFFMCDDRKGEQWPPGVYETESRAWWCNIETPDKVSPYWVSERWKMVQHWLSRAAPILEEELPRLPAGPVLLHTQFEGHSDERESRGKIAPLNYDQARDQIAVQVDARASTVFLFFSGRFEDAILHPENIAERVFVEKLVCGFAQLACAELANADRDRLVQKIVPDVYARQQHAFWTRNFRDFVAGSVPPSPVTINDDDDAIIRLGLGWRVRTREQGGSIQGKQECTAFLNSTVHLLEEEICGDLHGFDRRSVLAFALCNHESAMMDQNRWERTMAAVLSLHEDKDATRKRVAERSFELSAVFQAMRLLIEFAISECPLTGGTRLGHLDASRLMAKLNLMAGLGNWSDAIHWDAMEPYILVTPLGDIHASADFFEKVVVPFGHAGSDVRVTQAVKDYAIQFDDETISKSAEDLLEAEFLSAWKEEFGASMDDTRKFVDLIQDLGIRAQRAVLMLPKSSIVETVTGTDGISLNTAALLTESLTFKNRESWRTIPDGYIEKDLHPWRFRRRLSVLRKPILKIDDLENPTMIVAPGILRDAFSYMVHNFYYGNFPAWQLKAGMGRWFGISRARRQSFNRKVADRLSEFGWNTKADVKVSNLLKLGGLKGYGDVDVLAWSHEWGRVLVIECKDVQYLKTDGEIAEQLADFRGEFHSNGKPDDLMKHLSRVDVISKHVPELMKFTGLENVPRIEGHLVFKHPVPMQFAWERIQKRVSLHVFAGLAAI
jgi:hypothetical protein